MKILIKPICFLLLMLTVKSARLCAQQTLTISGTVRDDKDVLPGATVFLTGTKFMTATDLHGDFKFAKVPAGNYSLVVKMLGFAPFLKPLMVANDNISLNIMLQISSMQLNEVVIKPDKEWFKNLDVFKKQFLGENHNASQCKILNAEILTLTNDKTTHILKAETDRLLNIENRALGYKLTYVLTSFEYNTQKNTVVYQGYQYFESLKGTAEEEAQWKQNRVLAYEGSIQHFIKSLYNNNTRKDGFLVYQMKNWVPGGYGYHKNKDSVMRRQRVLVDTLINPLTQDYKKFHSSQSLFVVYTKRTEDPQYQADGYSLSELYDDRRLPESQSSILNLLASSVTIDGRGAFYRAQDIFFEGYMGWQKVSNLTPLGFDPEKIN